MAPTSCRSTRRFRTHLRFFVERREAAIRGAVSASPEAKGDP
jgi:hypothetical protein